MEDNINEQLLERAGEAVHEAAQHSEYWTNTTTGKMVDSLVESVTDMIEDNNLDDLYMSGLPALERLNKQLSKMEFEIEYDPMGLRE